MRNQDKFCAAKIPSGIIGGVLSTTKQEWISQSFWIVDVSNQALDRSLSGVERDRQSKPHTVPKVHSMEGTPTHRRGFRPRNCRHVSLSPSPAPSPSARVPFGVQADGTQPRAAHCQFRLRLCAGAALAAWMGPLERMLAKRVAKIKATDRETNFRVCVELSM